MKITQILCAAAVSLVLGIAAAQTPARTNIVGAIQAIDSSSGQITLRTDDGKTIKIAPHSNAKLLRLPPGEKSMANATPITAKDLDVGDRILARGELSDDKSAMAASTLVIMTKSDLAKQQQADRAEWQKRGVRGLVTAVDASAGTITITTRTAEGRKPLVIQTTKQTSIRRYASDSVKFAEAKPSAVAEVKVGDQVQALGKKSDDGTQYAADELVSGTFRNVAATIISIDAAANTIKVTDLTTKKPLLVHVNSESTIRKLPEMIARGIAMRAAGAASGAAGAGAPGGGGGTWPGAGGGGQRPQSAPGGAPGSAPGGAPGGPGGGQWAGRGGDMQQMLEHMPALKLEDMKPGDALIISSTEGTDPSQVTAITLVAGVEPILTSAASGTQRAAVLGSWNLDMGGGMGGEQ